MNAAACDLCRGASETQGRRCIDITMRRQRIVVTLGLCDPCYTLFRARMKETAVDVARQEWTWVAPGWRVSVATWCLRLAGWLVAPTSRSL